MTADSMVDLRSLAEALEEIVRNASDRGSITPTEVMDALADHDLSPEQLEEVYRAIRGKGIEVAEEADDDVVVDLDRGADSTLGADSVRMYLQEIGRVPLLTAEEEVDLAQRIEAGLLAEKFLLASDLDKDVIHKWHQIAQ